MTSNRPLLAKRIRINKASNTLANGEAALGALAGNGLIPTLLLRELLAPFDTVNFLLPTHEEWGLGVKFVGWAVPTQHEINPLLLGYQ
jgi:hypothetical protein